MKPYLLVLHNYIKLSFIRFKNSGLSFYPIEMISRNSSLRFHSNCRVTLGNHLVSDGRLVIDVDQEADLYIGDRVYFNEGNMISCKKSVYIGMGCKFGPNVKIFDNNHRFSPEEGVMESHTADSITIGEKCWIGANCVILKGTEIGDHSVIGAGCVVQGRIPPHSIVIMGRNLIITPMEQRT